VAFLVYSLHFPLTTWLAALIQFSANFVPCHPAIFATTFSTFAITVFLSLSQDTLCE
jgi:hypothetical protein